MLYVGTITFIVLILMIGFIVLLSRIYEKPEYVGGLELEAEPTTWNETAYDEIGVMINEFKFEKTENGWATIVRLNWAYGENYLVEFNNYPKDILNVKAVSNSGVVLKNVPSNLNTKVYIAVSPQLGMKGMMVGQSIVNVLKDIMVIKNVELVSSENNKHMKRRSCASVDSNTRVAVIQLGNSTQITRTTEGCVIVEGRTIDKAVLASERLLFNILDIAD